MLDRSTKLDASLMDAYNSIHELHKGHAAGSSDLEKQASQLASDIRYKAKGKFKEGTNAEDKKRIYLSLLASSTAPAIVKNKAKKKLLGESVIGEEGYDHWRDKHLERGGIGAVASKSPSRPYKRSEKQPKGDTAYQKEMRAKHGGKLPSALDVVKKKIEDEHGKGAIMKTEETAPAVAKIIDAVREDAQYGYDSKGRSKNPADIKKRKKVSEGKLIHGPFGPYITGQKMPKEQKETPLKKVPYEGLNGNRKSVGEASVEEEVGVSSSAAMKAAQAEAKLRKKEEDAVKKEKKALKKEEVNIDETRLKGSQKAVTLKPSYGDHLGDMYSKDPDEGELETMLKTRSKQRRADTIRPLKQKVKATAKKMNKEEAAPSVEKVIEAIKINKCLPASPNVVIMPKKDDITDKAGGKTTKDVVSKKHKQFFNKEDKVKTFRQFVTEAENVDEGIGSLTKGLAKVGGEVVKKGVKTGVDVVKGGVRLSTDAVRHGGDALQKGAETMKKTGSISQGLEKSGVEFSRNRTIANIKRNPNLNNRLVNVAKSPIGTKHSEAKWKKTKAKVKTVGKVAKDTLEVGANVKQLVGNQENKSRDQSGSRSGELKNPT